MEVVPEPTPEERKALEAALAQAERPEPGRSDWWREGVRESLEDDSVREP